jgi:hypothetical protein
VFKIWLVVMGAIAFLMLAGCAVTEQDHIDARKCTAALNKAPFNKVTGEQYEANWIIWTRAGLNPFSCADLVVKTGYDGFEYAERPKH